jgi:hypothetical protein
LPAAFYPADIWALAPAVLVCSAGCIFHAVRSFLSPDAREHFSDPRLSLLFLALVATTLWSVTWRFAPGVSIPQVLLGGSYAILFWAGFKLRNNTFFSRSFALFVSLAALYQTVLGVIQWHDSSDTNLAHRAWEVLGTYDVHTELAGLLALALPLTAGLLFTRSSRWIKAILGLLLLGLAAGLVIVAARAVWTIMLFVSIIALVLLPGRKKYLWASAALATAGAAAYLGRDIIMSRLALWSDWRHILADPRFECWSVAARLLIDNPWTGVGLGFLPTESISIKPPDLDQWAIYAFNYFLHMGAETGFFGLAVFSMFFLLCGVSALRVLKQNSPDSTVDPLKKAASFAVICFLLHSLIDHNFQTPFNAAVFMLLAASIMHRPGRPGPLPSGRRSLIANGTAAALTAVSLFLLTVLPFYAQADRHFQLGHAKMLAGRSVEAKDHFKRALDLFAFHYPAAIKMAELWTHVALNDKDTARKKLLWRGAYQHWSNVVRLNPEMPEDHISLVKARIGMNGDVVSQVDLDDLSRHIDKRPGQPRSMHMAAAFVLARCGQNDLACSEWAIERLRASSLLDPKFKWRFDQELKKYQDRTKRSSS